MSGAGIRLSEAMLPEHHFAERHAIRSAARPGALIASAARMSFDDDPLLGRLLSVRALPAKLIGDPEAARREAEFSLASFTPLGEVPGREVAWGLAGRFWRPDGGLHPLPDAAAFLAYAPPGSAKLVWSFEAAPEGRGTRLTTRTRVWCTDAGAWLRFAPYWAVIRPWSGLIRRRLLGAIRARAERGAEAPA